MKKLLSIILAAVLMCSVAACGGGDASTSEGHIPAPGSQASGEVVAESHIPPSDAAYLTGLEKGSDYPEGQRVIGVMVNNIMGSRPTRGLSEAQVLYEMRVEGGITRFMAVFEDYKNMPMVGSVRSARDQFFQMLVPSYGFYVHDGPNQNQPVIQMIKDQEYGEFDLTPDLGITWRDPERAGMPLEYTEYTDGEHIAEAVEENNLDDERSYGSTMFAFTPYDEEPRQLEGGPAESVAVIHSDSYRNLFEYDAASNRYMMSQFSANGMTPAIDENNDEQLGFNNLLVLFTIMYNYTNSELVYVGFDSGIGYYFNGGNFELVRWKKGGPQAPLQIFVNDTTETTNYLNPGNTYIAMIDDIRLEDFHYSVVEGTAAEEAADGTINPNETETED
ncbi:DUF3048 domain-containing protein [Ruminococcaceae bacterium OttesenSCG-928-I18]|nr:DUF3048 domain-containing protein [Ruminococcaceae bacterium OttesenSCG-928-I18]